MVSAQLHVNTTTQKADKSFHVKRQGDKPAVKETATTEAAQPPVVNSKQRPKGCEAAAGSWSVTISLGSFILSPFSGNTVGLVKV